MSENLKEKNKPVNQKKKDFSEEAWAGMKEAARDILIKYAKERRLITYSELSDQIPNRPIHYHSDAMNVLLRELSLEEDEKGHGMLPAIVIEKGKNAFPRIGFFTQARKLGKAPKGKMGPQKRDLLVWATELKMVFGFYSTN